MSQYPAMWGHGVHFHATGGLRGLVLGSIQCILCVVFLVMGVATLMNVAAVRPVFDQIGAGEFFRYFIGFIEILAALLLVSPMGLAGVGALLGMCVLAGAIVAHTLWSIEGGIILPLIGLLLCAIIAWERQELWIGGRTTTIPPPLPPSA